MQRRVVDLGRAHARARRGRPHARHGLSPDRRAHRQRGPARSPDDALLGDARRDPRSPTRHTPTPVALETAPPKPRPADVDHRFLDRRTRTRPTRSSSCSTPTSATCALVFVRTKRGAARLAKRLGSAASRAAAMHGDMAQSPARARARRFERGERDALVATDVAARGLDLDPITHVVNFDPPSRPRGLRPPRRPHRPCGPHRHEPHARARRSARGRQQDGRPRGRRRAALRAHRHAADGARAAQSGQQPRAPQAAADGAARPPAGSGAPPVRANGAATSSAAAPASIPQSGSDVERHDLEPFDVDQAVVGQLELGDDREREEAERHERGRG